MNLNDIKEFGDIAKYVGAAIGEKVSYEDHACATELYGDDFASVPAEKEKDLIHAANWFLSCEDAINAHFYGAEAREMIEAIGGVFTRILNAMFDDGNTAKKYDLTAEAKSVDGSILHRIRALRDFMCGTQLVRKGEVGGWIEKESNLAHSGGCWVYDEACVYGDAVVSDTAMVSDAAQIFGHAVVGGDTWVGENARVYECAAVREKAWVRGNAQAFGHAELYGESEARGNAKIHGFVEIYDCATVGGDVEFGDDEHIGDFDDVE